MRMIVDPALWKAFQFGLVLGGVILSTLLLFPGPRNDDNSRTDARRSTAPENASAAAAVATEDEPIGAASLTKNGDDGLRRQRRRQPRENNTNGTANDHGYWTPHRRLNAGVYVILIVLALFLVVQSYTAVGDSKTNPSSLLGMLIRTYFPKEAAVVRGANRGD